MFADVGDARVRYEDRGAGEPIVLLGGFGANAEFWEGTVAELDGFRVITLDNRGVGSTEYAGRFSVADMADDVNALLGLLGIGSAHVLGWSMGSQIAQCLAVRHPDRVRTLTLVASYLRFPLRADYVLRELTGMVLEGRAPMDCLAIAVNALCVPEAAFDELDSRGLRMTVPERMEKPGGLMDQLDAMSTYSGEELEGLDVPTLVVHGRRDAMIECDDGAAVAGRIPDSELLLVDAGHNVPFGTYRDRFLDLVRRGRRPPGPSSSSRADSARPCTRRRTPCSPASRRTPSRAPGPTGAPPCIQRTSQASPPRPR